MRGLNMGDWWAQVRVDNNKSKTGMNQIGYWITLDLKTHKSYHHNSFDTEPISMIKTSNNSVFSADSEKSKYDHQNEVIDVTTLQISEIKTTLCFVLAEQNLK